MEEAYRNPDSMKLDLAEGDYKHPGDEEDINSILESYYLKEWLSLRPMEG